MDIGKGYQTTIKFVYALSNSISLHLCFILLKIVVLEKNFQKPNSPPPPPSWVFFLLRLVLFSHGLFLKLCVQ